MTIRLKLATAALAFSFLSVPAYTAGGGGDSGSSGTTCKSGEVADKDGKCVPKQSAIDDDLFNAGRALAYAGRYGEAIETFGFIDDKNDPRVLNMLGFSHRKSGRIEVGLGYYAEALRIDPDFVLAREYMGEAFLTLGDIEAAKGQLAEIGKRCGEGCAEYAELERQIGAAVKG